MPAPHMPAPHLPALPGIPALPALRRAAAIGAAGAASLMLVALTPVPASAHGALSSPVSRISACYAQGPEHPQSQVCKDLVAMSGTQPLYDWNEVNIANADGHSREIIPDGKLCSANRDKYKALDMARTDWRATSVAPGAFNVGFRVTAPHRGVMTLYITKAGYDPTQPLKWSDLDTTPIATYTTTASAPSGYYNFTATLPSRSGRHLIYQVWQRTDSPEAFYGCSDVVFGQGTAAAAPAAPSDQQIAAGVSRSTVSHHGHGGDTSLVTRNAAASGRTAGTLTTALGGSAVLAAGAVGMILRGRRRTASGTKA
ncbi:lytic polysaccharide monooxygenase [Streptomyces sp. H10-C2]|uniref:lytic polysaccharide monooxygenase auxiliary activity family 9 protein n=1 Tax=unclassified Streptomyces TaxID=2593676 RepID=UPI0024BB75C6|nr:MULTISPECIES: lytic polysaccharide monooxygenase [unclassified Streptomyces]MDJ0344861.1 lytic polysaccharide monooxygenase [Streptomyces sp. PH10-H1]MDJ0371921.1 lytic polysaccharide monooxygenase [Streptomyces sp. H10-C2]